MVEEEVVEMVVVVVMGEVGRIREDDFNLLQSEFGFFPSFPLSLSVN